jgi:hypothetical protein
LSMKRTLTSRDSPSGLAVRRSILTAAPGPTGDGSGD